MSCPSDVIGGVAGEVAGSAADEFFKLIANGARDMLGTVSTFWMKVPSPEVASGSGQNWTGSETIMSIQSWISPLAFVIFLISLGMALLKIAFDTRRAGEGANAIVRSLVTTLAGGLPILAITMLGVQFGDEFSPWVLAQASGQDTSDGFSAIFVTSMMGSPTGVPATSGALLIIYILAILGALAQCVFMVVRGAMIIVLLSFSQVAAAGTATEEGWLRFKRMAMLLVGFVLYKPVAAVIYGVGLKLMSDGADTSQQVMNAIYGLTVMVLAALALPAVIKFVSPAAAMGSSSAFSGGAAVGAVATGAAVVALAGGGGAGAGASGAGSSGAGSSGAGAGSPDLAKGAATPAGSGGDSPGAKDAGSSPTGGGGDSGGSGDSGGESATKASQESSSSPGTGGAQGGSPEGGASMPGAQEGGESSGGSQDAGSSTTGAQGSQDGGGSATGAQGSQDAGSSTTGAQSGGGSSGGSQDGGGSTGGSGADLGQPDTTGASQGSSDGGRHRESGGGTSSAVQAGAKTVQSLTNQMNQGVEDASEES